MAAWHAWSILASLALDLSLSLFFFFGPVNHAVTVFQLSGQLCEGQQNEDRCEQIHLEGDIL